MSMENQKPEPNKKEEEQGDLSSMRSEMRNREDAPNAAPEKDGLLKNIGKIFTKKLPSIEETEEDELTSDSDPLQPEPSWIKKNETKSLPELDDEVYFQRESQQDDSDFQIDLDALSADKEGYSEANPAGHQPAFHDSPTIPRKPFHTQPLENEPFPKTTGDPPKTKPLAEPFSSDPADHSKTKPLPEIENEDFVEKITASLREDVADDVELGDPPQPHRDFFLMEDSMVEDIEHEIDHAAEAKNPFELNEENESDDDFLSRLAEMFPEQKEESSIRTKPLSLEDEFTDFLDDENSLTRENWEQVFEATQETPIPTADEKPLLNAASQDQDLSQSFEEMIAVEAQDTDPDLGDLLLEESDDESTLKTEADADLNTLRQSFIEEFEQSPWAVEDEESDDDKPWVSRKWTAFKEWVKTLSTAEKILMFLSVIISLSVLAAVSLVAFEWNLNRNNNATPPETLHGLSDLEVYPTGLQLPGGWFFYLQQGQIEQSGTIGKWEPQGAEWLAGTTIRRVVAIPWSKQAEAVALSLEDGDEIRLFLNNNEVSSFFVDELKTVEYDNVRDTMIDTKPSLAVILYRDDKADRLVIIARPK